MDVPLVPDVVAGPVSRSFVAADDLVTAAFATHRDELFSFLARTTRDDAEAEDLLQETFLRLSREVRAGRVPDQLRAWLYRVAANLATSRFRRRSVARRWLERVGSSGRGDEAVDSPEAGLLGRERFGEMERALAVVSKDARLALLLSAQGFSGREIARAVGRSEAATRTMMSRARVEIRAALERGAP